VKLSDLLKQAPAGSEDGKPTVESLTGEAVVEVLSAKFTVSKAGNDMVALDLRVVDGVGAGRKSKEFVVSTDNPDAMPFLIEKLSALGVFKKELLEQDDWTALAAAMVGRRARVMVRGEEYNHRVSVKVAQWIEPAGKSSSGPAAATAAMVSPDWGDDGGEY
jgi:hypothetical protein